MQRAVDSIFSQETLNFLSLRPVLGLKVSRGDNQLDTCYQFSVKGFNDKKLLNIKCYDKVLDLLSRDGQ